MSIGITIEISVEDEHGEERFLACTARPIMGREQFGHPDANHWEDVISDWDFSEFRLDGEVFKGDVAVFDRPKDKFFVYDELANRADDSAWKLDVD